MAAKRGMKVQRAVPLPTRHSHRLKELAGAAKHEFVVLDSPVSKRQRTHRVQVQTPEFASAGLSFCHNSRGAAGPHHMISASPLDYYHSPDSDTFALPQKCPSGLPRVASSAHINELVAKYSHPFQDHDLWFHQAGFSSVYRSHDITTPDLLEAKLSDCSVIDHPVPYEFPLLNPTTRGSAEPPVCQAACQAGVPSPKTGGSFFEDLALMAANADIEGGVAGEACEPAFVEGMEMEDATRQAVEKWLRDSPETGPEAAQDASAEEEERSLPQWVLDELGENEDMTTKAPSVRLVRADSHGSSTNAPSLFLKGDAWEEDRDSTLEVRSSAMAPGILAEASDPPLQRALQFDEAEMSVYSSPGAEEIFQDETFSREAHGNNEAVVQMSRSFSTAWMKDLLEDDLGALQHAPTSAADEGVVMAPEWAGDSFLAL